MLTDNSKKQRIYSVLVLVVALGQFMCAYGSGGASGADSVLMGSYRDEYR